jgi:hypothetical protein
VQPRQIATEVLICVDPEKESGNNNPPVPTYAEIELSPPTSGVAAELAKSVDVTNPKPMTTTKAHRANLIFK